jgi:hypothetical protein
MVWTPVTIRAVIATPIRTALCRLPNAIIMAEVRNRPVMNEAVKDLASNRRCTDRIQENWLRFLQANGEAPL